MSRATTGIDRASASAAPLANGALGLGLRAPHFDDVLGQAPAVDWFEILSENFMHTGGRPLHYLDRIAERYPITMHGVSLNIGSVDPLDRAYLRELRALMERTGARVVSDHLCWTGVDGTQLHDLLPLPYTEEALAHLAERISVVQDDLGTQLVLENPSTYLELEGAAFDEAAFLTALVEQTGCGLLLDVNNVYVSHQNHGRDAAAFLAGIPWDHVAYVHLAGHSQQDGYLLDSHSGPVAEPVWALYGEACRLAARDLPTMVEWDADVPSFDRLHAEMTLVRDHR